MREIIVSAGGYRRSGNAASLSGTWNLIGKSLWVPHWPPTTCQSQGNVAMSVNLRLEDALEDIDQSELSRRISCCWQLDMCEERLKYTRLGLHRIRWAFLVTVCLWDLIFWTWSLWPKIMWLSPWQRTQRIKSVKLMDRFIRIEVWR